MSWLSTILKAYVTIRFFPNQQGATIVPSQKTTRPINLCGTFRCAATDAQGKNWDDRPGIRAGNAGSWLQAWRENLLRLGIREGLAAARSLPGIGEPVWIQEPPFTLAVKIERCGFLRNRLLRFYPNSDKLTLSRHRTPQFEQSKTSAVCPARHKGQMVGVFS